MCIHCIIILFGFMQMCFSSFQSSSHVTYPYPAYTPTPSLHPKSRALHAVIKVLILFNVDVFYY